MTQIKICIVLIMAVIYMVRKVHGSPLGAVSGLGQSLSVGSGQSKDSGGSGKSKDPCRKVKCQEPPKGSNCTKVSKKDKSIPRPEGEKAKCCPVWKCSEKHEHSFMTFHGVDGDGSETVRYSKDKNSKTGRGNDTVISVATGNHDATANAGTNADDLSQTAMKDISKTLKGLGLSL